MAIWIWKAIQCPRDRVRKETAFRVRCFGNEQLSFSFQLGLTYGIRVPTCHVTYTESPLVWWRFIWCTWINDRIQNTTTFHSKIHKAHVKIWRYAFSVSFRKRRFPFRLIRLYSAASLWELNSHLPPQACNLTLRGFASIYVHAHSLLRFTCLGQS
jgi:hypothetical protein